MSTYPLSWSSASLSHVGNVRKLNEDSSLDRSEIGLWVVADGMGGHAAGDLASQLVVNTLSRVSTPLSLSGFIDTVEDGILAANNRLISIAKEKNQTSGSTVVALLAYRRHVVYMWAGDSRLYRLRAGQLEQLTTDHSQVELFVAQGLLSREEAASHPAGNMVTRAVGAADSLFLEMDMCEMLAGDRYLLCSDGLDKHVADPEIAQILGQGMLQDAAKRLIDVTLSRGATDNVTVTVVEIRAGTAPLGEGVTDPRFDADATVPAGVRS